MNILNMLIRILLVFLLYPCYTSLAQPVPEGMPEEFTSIFNGRDLTGWRIAPDNHHGDSDGWTVENGLLIGRQRPRGNGGVLMTNQMFGDLELYMEVKADWGCDGGVFLRTLPNGCGYQIGINCIPQSTVGNIRLERIWGPIRTDVDGWRRFYNPVYPRTNPRTQTMWHPDDWEQHWNQEGWNSLLIRMQGQPPIVTVRLNGVQALDWADTMIRCVDEGPVGLQVHGGTDIWKKNGQHAFRNIAVKPLK